MLTLFKTMVRSRLEYCCPVWNPRKITDIEAIENVQRNYTRRILGCQQLDYWDRLKELDLLSLQRRRERYILIHTWKMANDLAPNDIKMVFKENARHGIKAIVPPLNNKSQRSVATHYENSFGVNAATSEQPNCSRTLQGITCSIFGDVSRYPANQRIHRHHQQLTLGMESTERPEPGMIGGRTSYCCPEAIPAKPT